MTGPWAFMVEPCPPARVTYCLLATESIEERDEWVATLGRGEAPWDGPRRDGGGRREHDDVGSTRG